ncbi:citrate synthase [Dermatophilus congolensis]|uniref:Citrate synthase n=1 Tax=Dermatophilus congolensis TaxID=1863 RepID=A0A239V5K1_9MICO|nr:citrate synthase [Dermatophilus congolensis]MBO3130276.1 citrate synthase [Dermatophilus congolensis]MBO3131093.1 citrate synthase [Dermatophilus congolensis]MBO3134747.1 citrate synthase [Dermatophilus congolensis]MBO3136983.1 citrate synthase [Dermatophilus congolensis]MBO3139228.1 citrate synthase [Dermatophilus congolensis]
MSNVARLDLDGSTYELPIVVGTENEHAIDISKLRTETGYITLDDGYGNTGSTKSAITYIDGEAGILRYRGYPIEELAEGSSFVETAWLVIFGELPTIEQRDRFSDLLAENAMIDENMKKHFDGFPPKAHPMAILSAMIQTLSAHEPEVMEANDESSIETAAAVLISKVRTIAAAAYKSSIGEPIAYPRYNLKYVENFMHMMFSVPYKQFECTPAMSRALNLFLVLHADHEQNCSTSTVRMVASSQANIFASASAGVSALWGPRHGGANMAVIKMLKEIKERDIAVSEYVKKVKNKEDGVKLQGFGHRVYRNFDPRSKILRSAADDLFSELEVKDDLLDIAQELADAALNDDYFIERKLYPNVDFYSGIILRALGIPLEMFTVMFAIGRMPGWIANWKEIHDDPKGRIYRPRQIYTGETARSWKPRTER